MALDFQQVREQIKKMGENAPKRARRLQKLHQQAFDLLKSHANDLKNLHKKVQLIVQNYEPNLRCALPALQNPGAPKSLNGHYPTTTLPKRATILAADGSQIAPDRHAAVNYCLINVGAIQMALGSPEPPQISVRSQLFYDEGLYTDAGVITDARLALLRDLNERTRLAELAQGATAPVVTLADGPMELWGAKDGQSDSEFQKSLQAYTDVLSQLNALKVATAGYVDKPASNLVVRLLEVAMLSDDQLPEVKRIHPLRGVIDIDLFLRLLSPGERSAVFAIQSRSAHYYRHELSLHFFYLNVGQPTHPWLARIEIPAWVAGNPEMLNHLHGILIQQCRIMGNRPYPYVLHRAHEAALVSKEEKNQIAQMIALEMHRRGVEVGKISHKQSAKELAGRTKNER